MRIAKFNVRSFRIPFNKSITVGGKRLDYREGLILALVDDQQQQFIGEVAPLPGLDGDSLSQCKDQLCLVKSHLKGHLLLLDQFDLKKPLLGLLPAIEDSPLTHLNASVRFGLESALLQLALRYDFCRIPDVGKTLEILVNGLFIPSDDPNWIKPQLDALQLSGFNTIKVKIGRIAPEREIKQICQLVDFFDGTVTLRLDGNRSLNLADYNQYYRYLGSLPVEYVEEPLPAGKWAEALTVPWPLALDESLADFLDGPALVINNLPEQVRHIIVKPAAVQGVHGLFRLLAGASKNGIQVVISSAFNTGIGLSSMGLISHLSSSTHETAHGLDTLKYLAGDLLTKPLTIREGKLSLPMSLFMADTRLNSRYMGDALLC